MSAAQRHMDRVGNLPCCVCARMGLGETRAELHHVAEGSSKRSDFAVVPLCREHHQGGTGFHVLKEREFCKRYRVPWEQETGLLVWTNEDLAKSA